MRFHLTGEAQDYVGKGMSGGEIVVVPPPDCPFPAHRNVIVGNTVLYGATGGSLFAAGRAGERFCVRNSGALAVVEGCGDHGCEYMTNGVAVVLGPTGRNFGAGMSGGMAFVLDLDDAFARRLNPDMVGLERMVGDVEAPALRQLVERHRDLTRSRHAGWLLDRWDDLLPRFWKVLPHPPAAAHEAPPVPDVQALIERGRRERRLPRLAEDSKPAA